MGLAISREPAECVEEQLIIDQTNGSTERKPSSLNQPDFHFWFLIVQK